MKPSISDVNRFWPEDGPVKVSWCPLSNTIVIIGGGKISIQCRGVDLKDYDYVWIQYSWRSHDLAYAIAVYLDSFGVRHSFVEPAFSKLVDSVRFELNGNHVPDTFFCFNEDMVDQAQKAEEVCGYPMIVKDTKGECGIDVFLVNDKKEFIELAEKLPIGKKFLCQRYIPNTFDYRIIVGNDKVLLGEKRIRGKGEYRNNVSLGAKEEFIPLESIPDGVKERAIASTKTLGLPWTGVDIVTDEVTGKDYVLEVNRRPGITAGSPEAAVVAEFLVKLVE
jgi:glutathione synthase/RimK-type ligase-like ATP-grasp enzyme